MLHRLSTRVLPINSEKSCVKPTPGFWIARSFSTHLLTRNRHAIRQWRCGMAELFGPGSVALIMSALIWLLARVSLDCFDEQETADFR